MDEGRSNAGASKRKSVKEEEYDEYPKEAKQVPADFKTYICDDRTPTRLPRPPREVNPEPADPEYEPNSDRVLEPNNNDEEVIFDGGDLMNLDEEYKPVCDSRMEPTYFYSPGNDVEIEVRGIKYKIPYAINCHLCCDLMNLCIRRTRYRGQTKEYPAYRCNRKGCQTFRSVKKVFNNWKTENNIRYPDFGNNSQYENAIRVSVSAQKNENQNQNADDGFDSENDYIDEQEADQNSDYLIHRVNIPRYARTYSESLKPMTMTDRMKLANQERAVAFSEFSDQLRRDIAANKRVKVRRHRFDEDDEQGTLLYISKELTAHEIVQLQDSITKILMTMKKIPTPMSVHDLPLFANCPWSKEQVERGLLNEKSLEAFCTAFTKAPQPPIPTGFVRRKDDILVYRNPEPFEVPEILRENSPRKTAASIVNYQYRKDVQEAKKYEKRFSERRYRAWKTLKRDFDSVENPATSSPPEYNRYEMDDAYDSAEEKRRQSVTLQQLMEHMEQKDSTRSQIRRASSDKSDNNPAVKKEPSSSIKMKWLDGGVPPKVAKNALSSEYMKKRGDIGPISLHEMMVKSLLTPSTLLKPQGSELAPDAYSEENNGNIKPGTQPSTPLFSDYQQGHQGGYFVNPYANHGFNIPQNPNDGAVNHDQNQNPQSFGNMNGYHFMHPPTASEPGSSGQEGSDPNYMSQFTYVHPHSGMPLTDPSSFLTSFIPSPLVKNAPVTFEQQAIEGEEAENDAKTAKAEPKNDVIPVENPPIYNNLNVEEDPLNIDDRISHDVPLPVAEMIVTTSGEEFKFADSSLKFDPPNVE